MLMVGIEHNIPQGATPSFVGAIRPISTLLSPTHLELYVEI